MGTTFDSSESNPILLEKSKKDFEFYKRVFQNVLAYEMEILESLCDAPDVFEDFDVIACLDSLRKYNSTNESSVEDEENNNNNDEDQSSQFYLPENIFNVAIFL